MLYCAGEKKKRFAGKQHGVPVLCCAVCVVWWCGCGVWHMLLAFGLTKCANVAKFKISLQKCTAQ